MKKKVILSLDAGGFKGIFAISSIKKCDEIISKYAQEKCFIDFVDIVSGSCVGSLLATSLVLRGDNGAKYKHSTKDIIDLLIEAEKTIVKNWLLVFKPMFTGESLNEFIQTFVGANTTFDSLAEGKKLLIPTVNLETAKLTLYTNLLNNTYNANSSFKDIRYVDTNYKIDGEKLKLHTILSGSLAFLMAFPANEIKYKLFNENEAHTRFEADGGFLNKTSALDVLSTTIGTDIQPKDIISINLDTGRSDYDCTDLKSGSIASVIYDAAFKNLSCIQGAFEGLQDNTSCVVNNIVNSLGSSSYLYDFNIDEKTSNLSFDPASIPIYLEIAENYCNEH